MKELSSNCHECQEVKMDSYFFHVEFVSVIPLYGSRHSWQRQNFYTNAVERDMAVRSYTE